MLIIGSGEYTTGFVNGQASGSDKGPGVVALCCFDLRERGLLGRILMAGTRGGKFQGIRQHFQKCIAGRYPGMRVELDTFPGDEVERDPNAWRFALDQMRPGDAVLIFTPDDTHAEMAAAALEKGCHVLVAKPLVQNLGDHARLAALAAQRGLLLATEVHKRWDPIYRDARDRIRGLGDFSYLHAYMSQPASQLDTFREWAGRSSDISYYLNTHHVDFHVWSMQGRARPVAVTAFSSSGRAASRGVSTEDVITLAVEWENLTSGQPGHALYTSSWVAPRSDVHSQQSFHYAGHLGEIQVDQAHRGYGMATDSTGLCSLNPLFMKYEPDELGRFQGRDAYGYRSLEAFVRAVTAMRQESSDWTTWRHDLALAADTLPVTAILEAGRISLDEGRRVELGLLQGSD